MTCSKIPLLFLIISLSILPSRLYAATASPTSSAHAPLTVTFSCSASGGTAPYSYLWDFGDGASSTEANTTHIYNSVGTFTAKVIVADFNGNTAQKTFFIKIGAIHL
ncbi:MAG TPA: PKD domain-containing protein [Acidobacteriota bacterium]|nr:PKD domain-containing protein [Acidobacteriota bacterium]HNT16961.1 PKD domain-containing protein [Acidobacteriota bacterium]